MTWPGLSPRSPSSCYTTNPRRGWLIGQGRSGATALAGNVDQIVRMAKGRNGQPAQITRRRSTTRPPPIPFDEPTTIAIASTGIEFVGTATEIAAETRLTSDYLGRGRPYARSRS